MINLADETRAKAIERLRADQALDKYGFNSGEFNLASQVGWLDDCERALGLARISPKEAEPFTDEALLQMDEGHKQEVIMYQEVAAAGYMIYKVPSPITIPKLELRCDYDYVVEVGKERGPLECKSCSPWIFNTVRQCRTPEELTNTKHIWIRHYPAQLMSYLYSDVSFSWARWMFKDRNSGAKHEIVIPKTDGMMRHYEKGLRSVNQMVHAGALPAPLRTDACKYCRFRSTVCFKGEDEVVSKEKLTKIIDPDLEAKLLRRDELSPFSKEYDKLDEEVKDEVRGKAIEVGDFRIWTSQYDRKTLEVPLEERSKYEKIVPTKRVNIKNLARPL